MKVFRRPSTVHVRDGKTVKEPAKPIRGFKP
jgi:hypothetical protein